MSVPWPVEMRAEQLVLELRELLVRCDENLKAWQLLSEAVPYFLDDEHHPAITRARADQHEMVRHVLEPDAYRDYYRANVHEKPFEDQYGIEAKDAHMHIPRVAILRERLEHPTELLDLSCNDGMLAANLIDCGDTVHGIDLNPGCVERGRARAIPDAVFLRGDIHDATLLTDPIRPDGGYEVVVCFECIEHVPDPDRTLAIMADVARPGGRLFVSTPLGAVEHGDLPTWFHVEPKGHVRVYTPKTFHELLSRHGQVEGIQLGQDGVMVAEVTTPGGTGEAVARPLADGHETAGGAPG